MQTPNTIYKQFLEVISIGGFALGGWGIYQNFENTDLSQKLIEINEQVYSIVTDLDTKNEFYAENIEENLKFIHLSIDENREILKSKEKKIDEQAELIKVKNSINDSLFEYFFKNCPDPSIAQLQNPKYIFPEVIKDTSWHQLAEITNEDIMKNIMVVNENNRVYIGVYFKNKAIVDDITPIIVRIMDYQQLQFEEQYKIKRQNSTLIIPSILKPNKSYKVILGFYFLKEINQNNPTFYRDEFILQILGKKNIIDDEF